MKHKTYKIVIVLSLVIAILTGCWDKVEINDLAIAMGIGIDKNEDMIRVIYAIPNLPVVTGQASGGEKRFVKISEGINLQEANENFANINNKKLSYDHAKTVILGSELLTDKKAMSNLMDYFNRSPEFALSLMIAATDKSAKELIENEPNANEVTGDYISGLYSKNISKEQSENRTDLLELLVEMIDTNGNGKLPLIVYKDGEIQKGGLVILKDYVKCYTLTMEQMTPYNWAIGKGNEVTKVVKVKDDTLSYEINEIKRKVKFKEKEVGFDIKIEIKMEGDIRGYELVEGKDVYDTKKIEEIQDILKEEFEKDIEGIIRTIQTDMCIDILDLSKAFKLQKGKLWEEYKDNWDLIVSASTIQVEVTPKVRRIGLSK